MTQKLVRQSLSFLNMTVIQPSAANVLLTAQGSSHLLCLPCLLVACGGMHCLLPHIILIVDKFYTGWRITHLGPGLGWIRFGIPYICDPLARGILRIWVNPTQVWEMMLHSLNGEYTTDVNLPCRSYSNIEMITRPSLKRQKSNNNSVAMAKKTKEDGADFMTTSEEEWERNSRLLKVWLLLVPL